MTETRRITLNQAARAGRCSTSTIHRLVREGKLKHEQETNGKKRVFVVETRDHVREVVQEHAPTSGFKRSGKPATTSTTLKALQEWVALDADKRGALLELADKYDAADLRFLLTLGD